VTEARKTLRLSAQIRKWKSFHTTLKPCAGGPLGQKVAELFGPVSSPDESKLQNNK